MLVTREEKLNPEQLAKAEGLGIPNREQTNIEWVGETILGKCTSTLGYNHYYRQGNCLQAPEFR